MSRLTATHISRSQASKSRNRRAGGKRQKRQTDSPVIHPLLQMQQTHGNRAVGRMIQAQLKISQPGDKYEQEADRVAEQVVNSPGTMTSQSTAISGNTQGPSMQRMPEMEEGKNELKKPDEMSVPAISRMPEGEEDKELKKKPAEGKAEEEDMAPTLQTKPAAQASPSVKPSVANNINRMQGGGTRLPKPVRAYFEPRMGTDFSQVWVHADAHAADTAKSINAKAFTVGRNIAFGAGEYSPDTISGRKLLAHELTHVVQQSGASVVSAGQSTENLGLSVQKRIIGSDPILSTDAGVRRREARKVILARVAVEREVEAHLSSPRFKGDERLEACFDDRSRLRVGDSGASVEKVQGALIELGFDVGPLGADGQYGPRTAEAVKAFKRQERLGFEQFGDVGPGTMRRLDQIFGEDTSESRGDVVAKPLALTGEGDGGPGEQFIEAPLAPPEALTVPPEEGDCDPPVAASAFAGGDVVAAGGSATVGSGVPCDFAPAPPGALSDFELDLRSNPRRISAVVVDPDSQEIIGYRVRTDSTILQLVDREGNFVAGNEKSLDQPLIDPIDFVPTPAALAKGAVVVGKIGLKVLGKLVVKGGGKKGFTVAAAAIPRMRAISQAMIGRAGRAASKKLPTIARNITLEGLNHSFDRHAAQFFGRSVTRETHFQLWRGIVERAAQSSQVFPWTLGANKTIAHLATIEGKQFVVHFFEESGNLASAFVPTSKQVRAMLKLIELSK